MQPPKGAHADLLPAARTLHEAGHRIALLDSPHPTRSDAPYGVSHLCLLQEPTLDTPPSLEEEHVCLATFEHGLATHEIPSRHGTDLGFTLAAYPVQARWTIDRATGETTTHGDTHLLDPLPPTAPGPRLTAGTPEASMTKQAFETMVEDAQAYIQKGHSYQVNLSLRLSFDLDGDATRLFDRLRRLNPSPYQALLLTSEVTLVSASPELLIDIDNHTLRTRPIAGTRPRGDTPQHDDTLAHELQQDAKERAEHAMLVDLARNDLGRVAEYGTVHVLDDAIIERYSHVMHLVSEVQAQLHDDHDAWDAFEAIFPCGTISGAPKHRSLEIIDELEPIPRGAYTGSLGLITPTKSTWNILIRTLVQHDQTAHVQAGAGIVADSQPENEFAESLAKAQAFLDALGLEATQPNPHSHSPWT